MQINGIARQLLAPLQFDSSSTSSLPAVVARSGETRPDDNAIGSFGPDFHAILSRFDVTDLTPRDFSNLIQELHAAGEIDDAEFRELARMRLELEQAGLGPDDRVNLVDFFEDKLRDKTDEFETVRSQADAKVAATLDEGAFTAEAKRQLEWVRKFALVQAAGAAGVDLGA